MASCMKSSPSRKLNKKSVLEWFLSVFIAGFIFFLTIWLIVALYLPHYTRHGEEVEIPYVIGISRDKAAQIMENKDLRYTFLGRGLYVIKTVPEAGTIVKIGRRVKLTLGNKSSIQ